MNLFAQEDIEAGVMPLMPIEQMFVSSNLCNDDGGKDKGNGHCQPALIAVALGRRCTLLDVIQRQ